MHPLLAFDVPQVTPTTIGLIVISIAYLSRWLWDYNRARREDAAQYEPKNNPPLHKEYATKGELAQVEKQLKEADTALKDAMAKLADAMAREVGVQAGKRKDIYKAIEAQGLEVASLKTDNTNQNRQLFNVETKVDRILERLPRKS